jgi:hypothetical protein
MKTQTIKPPKGYRLMKPEERPEWIRHDMVYYGGNWHRTFREGDLSVRFLSNEYARKKPQTKPQTRAKILREIERLTKKLNKLPTK